MPKRVKTGQIIQKLRVSLAKAQNSSVNGFLHCLQSKRRAGKCTYVALPQISRCRIQRSSLSCTATLIHSQFGQTAPSMACSANICNTSRPTSCSSMAYSVTTIPGSPNKVLNVLAVTRFIINPAARFVARAASRMIFTGPLGSIGNIFMAQGYSFLLHSPTNLGRTQKLCCSSGSGCRWRCEYRRHYRLSRRR